MTIAETREKCKSLAAKAPRDLLVIAVLVLASSLSFGLGFLAGTDAGQSRGIAPEESPLGVLSSAEPASTTGTFVASKNGTKYYLPECSGADRIASANKVWFATASAAEEAGYAPATNCKGI